MGKAKKKRKAYQFLATKNDSRVRLVSLKKVFGSLGNIRVWSIQGCRFRVILMNRGIVL